MNTELDTFETKLLADLRAVVDERAAARLVRDRRQRRIRWSVAAAAALITLGGAGFVALNQSSPAYAVAPHDDGSVTVTINRLEQASDLEAALARAGIRADVTYTRPGFGCAPGRFTPAAAEPSGGTMEASVDAAGAYSLTLPKNLLAAGQTLVLETSWNKEFWSLGLSIAEGTVGECRQVKVDPLVPPSEKPRGPASSAEASSSASPAGPIASPSPSR